jgi:hypothetical protein
MLLDFLFFTWNVRLEVEFIYDQKTLQTLALSESHACADEVSPKVVRKTISMRNKIKQMKNKTQKIHNTIETHIYMVHPVRVIQIIFGTK